MGSQLFSSFSKPEVLEHIAELERFLVSQHQSISSTITGSLSSISKKEARETLALLYARLDVLNGAKPLTGMRLHRFRI